LASTTISPNLLSVHRALQELGVGHQADLHEHAFQRHVVLLAGGAVFVAAGRCTLPSAPVISVVWALVCMVTLGRLCSLFDQHGVGLELVGKLNQR